MLAKDDVDSWDLDLRDAGKAANVHPATVSRWVLCGLSKQDGSRLHLEARRFGGKWRTNRAALQRFINRLTSEFGFTSSEADAAEHAL